MFRLIMNDKLQRNVILIAYPDTIFGITLPCLKCINPKPFKTRGVFLCPSLNIKNNLQRIMKGLTLAWAPSLREEFVVSLIWLEEYG